MCENIDNDYENFKDAISALRDGPRMYDCLIEDNLMKPVNPDDPAYLLRTVVCERSRFAWFSTMRALLHYRHVMDDFGSNNEPRIDWISRLFPEAIALLEGQDDRFLKNVRERWDELQPLLLLYERVPSIA